MDAKLRELERVSARIARDTKRRNELIEEIGDKATRRQVAKAAGLTPGRITQMLAGAVVVALLLAPSASGATTISAADGAADYPYQRWMDRVETPTPDAGLTVVETPCPPEFTGGEYTAACTRSDVSTIWLDPRGGSVAPQEPAQTVKDALLHELGHQFDYRHMTEAARGEFMALLGLAGPWRTEGNTHAWHGTSPHEHFAEAYVTCARHRTTDDGHWRYPVGESFLYPGTETTVSQRAFSRVCETISAVAP